MVGDFADVCSYRCDTCVILQNYCVCFFKQKTAYEMRISDWSSDVCSSDLDGTALQAPRPLGCELPRDDRGACKAVPSIGTAGAGAECAHTRVDRKSTRLNSSH